MIAMKCFKYRFLLLLSVVLVTFTACENEREQIDIALELDYSGLLAAVRDVDKSLSDCLAMIENAVNEGLADNQAAMKLIREKIASLDGTMEQKMAALTAAMQSQTAGLETKMALVEAAVTGGFADSQAQQKLLQEAVASLSGTLEQKMAAIETAIKAQTSSLETRIGLVEASIRSGFADSAAAQALIVEAIDATADALEEKVAAVEAVINSQTADLSAKLVLIETALKEGFAGQQSQQELLQKALEALGGTLEDKYSAIESAIKSEASSLEMKLALVEAAAAAIGTGEQGQVLEQIRQAIESLGGNVSTRISAIERTLSSQTTSLAAKVDLIAAAVEEGFLADTAAVHAMQKALDASLGALDADLSEVKDDILAQLDSVSKKLTTAELAKAFQGIREAIGYQAQSTAALLDGIQMAVKDLAKELADDDFELTCLADDSYTLVKRKEIRIPLRVSPANKTLTLEKMRLDIQESKQFFSTDAGTEADHFSIKSLEQDPAVEGQYIATLTADADPGVWDEATLCFKYNYGSDSNPKYATTQSFQATMMPGADEGLRSWVYPYATYCARDTFYTHKEGRYEADTLGVIYYVFDAVRFRQKNGSETRSYTVDNIDNIVFVPNSGAAPVKTGWQKKDQDNLHNSPYVTFCPDTTGSEQWRNIEHLLYERMDVSGTLVLTDTCGYQTSVPVNIGWYNPYELDLTLNVSVNDKHFVKTGEQTYLPYNLNFGFKYVGLDENLLLACRNNTGYRVDYNSDSLTQQDLADGYIPMTLNWTGTGCEANLIFDKNTVFASDQQYRVRGRIRLKMQPDESSSGFDPRQLLITYCITLKLTD